MRVMASETFNERVDRAIGRVDMSPVKSNASKSLRKSRTSNDPTFLRVNDQSTTSDSRH